MRHIHVQHHGHFSPGVLPQHNMATADDLHSIVHVQHVRVDYFIRFACMMTCLGLWNGRVNWRVFTIYPYFQHLLIGISTLIHVRTQTHVFDTSILGT